MKQGASGWPRMPSATPTWTARQVIEELLRKLAGGQNLAIVGSSPEPRVNR
jgi:hypothetical protein